VPHLDAFTHRHRQGEGGRVDHTVMLELQEGPVAARAGQRGMEADRGLRGASVGGVHVQEGEIASSAPRSAAAASSTVSSASGSASNRSSGIGWPLRTDRP
jgi:hypothetical protein